MLSAKAWTTRLVIQPAAPFRAVGSSRRNGHNDATVETESEMSVNERPSFTSMSAAFVVFEKKSGREPRLCMFSSSPFEFKKASRRLLPLLAMSFIIDVAGILLRCRCLRCRSLLPHSMSAQRDSTSAPYTCAHT